MDYAASSCCTESFRIAVGALQCIFTAGGGTNLLTLTAMDGA